MPRPTYRDTHRGRTYTAPDGTTVTVAFKPGTRTIRITAAELLAAICPDPPPHTPQTPTPTAATTGVAAPVINLAAERLKRHTPGTPYRAEEIAPLLTSRGQALAPGIAEVMTMLAAWPYQT